MEFGYSVVSKVMSKINEISKMSVGQIKQEVTINVFYKIDQFSLTNVLRRTITV
jgi:hypothetical protein